MKNKIRLLLLIIGFAFVGLVGCKTTDEYSVKFYVDNNLVSSVSVANGEKVQFPEDPTQAGYEFLGWFDNIEGEGEAYNKDHKFEKDTVLYAAFKKTVTVEYTIKFMADDKEVGSVKFTSLQDKIDEPKVPEKDGYIGKWETYELKHEDIVVNAVYELIEYTITFVDENDVIVQEVSYTMNDIEDGIEEPQLPEKLGYTAKWSTYLLELYEDQTSRVMYTPITYYATFKGGLDLDIEVAKVPFTVEDSEIKGPKRPPIVENYAVEWGSYEIKAENITINAVYTLLDNPFAVIEREYFDAKLIVDTLLSEGKLGAYDPSIDNSQLISSDIDEDTLVASLFNGEIQFVSSSSKAFGYEGVSVGSPLYKTFDKFVDDYIFEGFLKPGGATTVDGRYIILKPSVNSTFSMWVRNASAFTEHVVLLLSELRNPVLEGEVLDESIIVDQKMTYSKTAGKISFDLEGGNTYYIWFPHLDKYGGHGNRFLQGFEYTQEPYYVNVESIKLDTENVVKEFSKEQEFESIGLKVYAVDSYGKEHLLQPNQYTVTPIDTSSAGQYEVKVTYLNKDSFEASYNVEVSNIVKYTAVFKDDDTIIKEVIFTNEDTELTDIPDLPEKVGYTSEWSSYTLPATTNLEITVIYKLINYEIKFVANNETVKTLKYTIETQKESLNLPKVPFKQGFIGEWEDFDITILEDITVTAIYTDNSDTYIEEPEFEPSYADGRAVRDAAGLTGVSGNIDKNIGQYLEINEFYFKMNRAIQFDKATTKKTINGYPLYGYFKTGGAASINDRWIKVTPKADAVLYLLNTFTSSSGQPFDVLILDRLVDASSLDLGDEGVLHKVEVSPTATTYSFDVEAGKEYYIWAKGNFWVYGFLLEYKEKLHTTEELILDTTNVKVEYELNEEISTEGLIVKLVITNDLIFVLKETEYTVVAPDTTTSGIKEVVIKYGENKTVTYQITVK